MASVRALALVFACTTIGCVSRLDMAALSEAGRAATTIPYTGVRGSRTFADYESVSRSILTGVDPEVKSAKPGPKGAKPKGGSR